MLKTLCIVAVTVMLCVTLGEVAWTLHTIRPKVLLTIENVDRTVIVVGAAAGDVEKGAREWQQASSAQIKAVSQVSSNVSVAAARLGSLISRTDNSLNSSLIPSTVAALNQQNAALLTNQEQLQANLIALRSATESLQRTISDADKQVSSPDISRSLASLADSTKQLDAVSVDAKTAADLAIQKEREILNPPPKKLAIKLLEFFGGHLVDGTEMWYYLTH
jgi:hypothetical protein